MQREARIAQQVAGLERVAIRADPQLAVLDLRLDARDARRAVGPDRRDRLVPVRVEPLADTPGERPRARGEGAFLTRPLDRPARAAMGETPVALRRRPLLERAAQQLRTGVATVAD